MQRRFRLRRSADFELLRLEGRSWRHPIAILIFKANGQDVSRFAFSTNRRLGKATVRNRVKRQLREAVRRQIPAIEIGWDCLFVARWRATEASYAEIEGAVSLLLDRAGILLPLQEQNTIEAISVRNR